ncbi:unnamed protein product [Cochlearia groenlandica]
MTNFEVVPVYERYRVTETSHSIRFTNSTEIKMVKDDASEIKKEFFNLLEYSEYLSLANTNLKLPDVVGQILRVKGLNLIMNHRETNRIISY